MKRQFSISMLLLSTFLSLIAQNGIYTPSQTIQGSSGNNNVGIGTNSPVFKLDVQESANAWTARIYNTNTTTGNGLHIRCDGTGTSNTALGVLVNGSYAFAVQTGNGNVGIGTTLPESKLNIYQKIDATNAWNTQIIVGGSSSVNNDNYLGIGVNQADGYGILDVVKAGVGPAGLSLQPTGGYVGIGTTIPESKLNIYQKTNATNAWNTQIIVGGSSSVSNDNYLGIGVNQTAGYGLIDVVKAGVGPLNLNLQTTGGNVGIGTTTPGDYKLNVWGSIRAHEVVVNTDGADFVFDSDYNLPDLKEIEEFIFENKHLPNLDSATEMKENGMNVSEMQTDLLQKIEELTLYLIEQNKKNDLQSREIELLKQQVALLMEENK